VVASASGTAPASRETDAAPATASFSAGEESFSRSAEAATALGTAAARGCL
jgi:hypothetical protein